ncbi:MAG: zinc metallopeptidase [Hyphomicrobiales bacterium]|nr:zinc metallopeptidase [Hyphomicrobiales bacterium]MDE2115824.1 neutral zinc metallopeptidase [Hyphomicrobiales bacterium]
MKLEDLQSDNIEDRRGQSDDGSAGGGFGIPGVGAGGHLGLGAILIIGLISYFTGLDPRMLINGAQVLQGGGSQVAQTAPASAPAQSTAANDQMTHFISAILAENEVVWGRVLPAQKNIPYVNPKLVLYTGSTASACGGTAEASMGPFYCPNDQKVYLDTSFFDEMRTKLGGGGDFAYAYVVSHEIGHHVQNLMGILPKAEEAEQRAPNKAAANHISVAIELMADCFAGVWAANANQKWQILEPGDIEQAVNTAQAIGDDRLQTAARGYAVPDSFTHGSSAQRIQWLTTGLKSGQIDACNTFNQ